MWRTRAIVSTLIEDVAALPIRRDDPEGEGATQAPESLSRSLELLEGARKRARLVVAVDWIALLVLFLFRDRGDVFLPSGPTVEVVFTLGVLAVAVHSGFRLGQLEKMSAVKRVCEELLERDPQAGET